MKSMKTIMLSLVTASLCMACQVHAQDHGDLAMQAQNPISNMINLP